MIEGQSLNSSQVFKSSILQKDDQYDGIKDEDFDDSNLFWFHDYHKIFFKFGNFDDWRED